MKNILVVLLVVALILPACKSSDPAGPGSSPSPAATKLKITGVPSQLAASATFSVTVQALRADDSVDQNYTGAITIAKASGPGNLSGTLSKNAVGGIATFSDLVVNAVGTYTLMATSGALANDVTVPITVSLPLVGQATQLGFSNTPASIATGASFSVTVQAQRADNSVDTSFTGAITLALASGSGSLDGTTSKAAAAGVATFNDLALSTASFYTLRATSGALTAAVSASIAANALLKIGAFTGQNNYTSTGSLQIWRQADGAEVFTTGANFRVSGGAGSISIWLTDAAGANNLNGTSNKVQLGSITSGFSGVYTYSIPTPGLSSYTHAVTYCTAARINFGFAQLQNP